MTPLTRRATAEYRRATQAQREAGARWYIEAHEIARNQADEHGVTIEVASGVLAAMSPRLGWGSNVMIAERMLASRGTLDRGGLGRSLQQARHIYHGEDPLLVLGGPKTRAFYSAMTQSLPAEAHTGNLNVVYECDVTTGEYVGTPQLTVARTDLVGTTYWRVGNAHFEGIPSSNAGLDRGPVTSNGSETVSLGTIRIPGTTTDVGPFVYAFTTWAADGYTQGSDGQSSQPLKGDCERTKPGQPEPQTTTENRSSQVCVQPKDGTATLTTESRTGTKTPTFDPQTWAWAYPADWTWGEWAVTGVSTVPDVTCTRPPAPPIPEPEVVVTYGEWTGGEPSCEATTVEQTRTVTTTRTEFYWTWSEGEWVKGSRGTSSISTETQTLTYEGDCTVATPTPTAPPSPSAEPTASPAPTGTLAVTGGDNAAALTIGIFGAAVLALGALTVALRRRHSS